MQNSILLKLQGSKYLTWWMFSLWLCVLCTITCYTFVDTLNLKELLKDKQTAPLYVFLLIISLTKINMLPCPAYVYLSFRENWKTKTALNSKYLFWHNDAKINVAFELQKAVKNKLCLSLEFSLKNGFHCLFWEKHIYRRVVPQTSKFQNKNGMVVISFKELKTLSTDKL